MKNAPASKKAAAPKKKTAAPVKRKPANRVSLSKALQGPFEIGKLDSVETVTNAVQLILRHPRKEQGSILAQIYKEVKSNMATEIDQLVNNTNSMQECYGTLGKLMDEVHHGNHALVKSGY